MKIKVSKVFAKFIESNCPNLEAFVVELSEGAYNCNVGSVWDAGEDYNYKTGKYRAICVNYPAGWYSCPRYLSTAQIVAEFRRQKVTDAAGLVKMLNNWLQI